MARGVQRPVLHCNSWIITTGVHNWFLSLPFLFFHSAYKFKIELRRRFRHISLRIWWPGLALGKLSKISFFFGSLYFNFKFLPYGFVQYLCHTLYGHQINFIFEFNVYLFVLLHHIFLQKAQKVRDGVVFWVMCAIY